MTETLAIYTVKINTSQEQAQKILNEIDLAMIEFERKFPSLQVEV
jgi:hypothetical protein